MIRWLRACLVRLAATVRRSRTEADMAAELDSHLQMHVDDNIRAGLPHDEARRLALVALGGMEAAKERYRDRRRLPIVDALRQDVAYAVRTLRKHPGFSAVAIATLALGVGATSAIFSVINAVLLQPLPFRDPDALVMVYANGQGDFRHDVVSYPTFVDWRDQSRSFSAAAAFVNRTATTDADGQTEIVAVKQVSAAFFSVLGVPPALGRSLPIGADTDSPAKIAVLSDGFWRRRFGAAPDVVGRTVRLSDDVYTVVGVMPPGFHFERPEIEQVYVPLAIDANRRHGFLRIVARLRPGVSTARARADLDAVAARLTQIYPRNESVSSEVLPLADALAGPTRPALLILFGIVILLLVISCANVAGLLLARGAARQRELAVRAALGASRGRIAWQLLTESVVLGLAGGAAGVLLADVLARLLVWIVSSAFTVAQLQTTHTDLVVVAFAAALSFASGAIFGLLPAWSAATPNLDRSLRDAAPTTSAMRLPRLGRVLVITQTALALVLLAGAGVLMRTLLTMRGTDPGFDTRRLLAFELRLPPSHLQRRDDRTRFFQEALARVRVLPGVQAAALVADLPLGGSTDSQSFHIVGRPDPAPDRPFNAGFNVASAGYFGMMGIPIREGREFADSDGPLAPAVAIVNDSAARRFWPDRSPLGAQLQLPIARGRSTLLTVVGVTGDVRHRGLAEPPRPEIVLDSMQSELPWSEVVLAVRAAGEPATLAAPIKSALRAADPSVALARVRTMDDVVAQAIAEPRLFALLLAAFACAAMTLAAVGLYGLISYTVTQRTREMSIRLALGASRSGVLWLVLGDGVRLAAIGAALGVAGGLAATRVLIGLIKGVEPNDPLTFVAVVGILFAVALTATYLPARRAAHVDPMAALRVD